MWFRWLSAQGIEPRSPFREHIFQYKTHLQEQGKSKFTYLSYVVVVKLFYRYCSTRNYYDNIGEGINTGIKQRGHFKEALTSTQALKLMDSINTETIVGKRDKLIIALMLTNGLRTCEVHRLNICDFDKDGERTILHIQRKGRVDKNETIAVPEVVEGLFEEYIACREFNVEDPLIVNHLKGQKPRRLPKQTISHIVKQRLRAIGINDPKITAHSLRHTCGSLLVEMGLDVEMIKDLLGHSNTSTTRIYIEQAQRRRLIEENPGNKIGELITRPMKKQTN
ncbi:Tyrosine recombinase XerD [Mucinivorans hirudinis]|uniref:Integrase n=1 Tax=Mucinivorans hirudinis TaxID=1433126 RepID=A0A060R9T6_9BACT|nr:Integrase [Mucinivorans hirudinis]CDN30568.1 Tyrosine recombinase XerD [Mucinivorans hirudinis]